MTTTTDDDRAIAEALGWQFRFKATGWVYPSSEPIVSPRGWWCGEIFSPDMPTLETDDTLFRQAMEWLGERKWYFMPYANEGSWMVAKMRLPIVLTAELLCAALRAAMLWELGR